MSNQTPQKLNLEIGTLIDIAGSTFKVTNFFADDSVYVVKLGKDGKTLAPYGGNHGSYTQAQIQNFVSLGSMTILG